MSTLTLSNVSQSRSGTTVTLSFTAAHEYGVRNVHWKLYASNGTSILRQGEAALRWSLVDTVPYPQPFTTANSYMICTVTIPNATAGLYVILDYYTIIGQRTSRRVQLA